MKPISRPQEAPRCTRTWNIEPEIRRRVLVDGLSKRQAGKQFAINWKILQKILTHEEPPGYRRVKPPRRPTIEPVLPVIRGR